MDARTAVTVGELLSRLPASGPGRDLALLRLTDVYADREATAAARAAAARARDTLRQREESDVVATAVSAAGAIIELGAVAPFAVDVDFASDALRRDELSRAILEPSFLAVIPGWVTELRQVASMAPDSGACTVASAMQLWAWTVSHVQHTGPSTALPELAQAFAALIAARAQILEVARESATSEPSARQFFTDLCHVQAARVSGIVGALCAEVVFGTRQHPSWDAQGCATCYRSDDLDSLEGLIPGIASSARAHSDVIEADGSHPAKAGPCAKADGLDTFIKLRTKLDGCLTGARVAKARAAAVLPSVLASATVTPR